MLNTRDLYEAFGFTIGSTVVMTEEAKKLYPELKDFSGIVEGFSAYRLTEKIGWSASVRGSDAIARSMNVLHLEQKS